MSSRSASCNLGVVPGFSRCRSGVLIVSVWLIQGCASTLPASHTASRTLTTLEEPLRLSRGDWPVELEREPYWRLAAEGDEWALLHVARRRDLLRTGVEHGGPAAEVALRAWPLRPEAWVERGTLCRVLTRYVPEDWGSVLRALRKSATEQGTFGEELDPEASGACEGALSELDGHTAAMAPGVFDEYTAVCQTLGRTASGSR